MPWTPTRVYGPAQPGTTATTLYTAPAGGAVLKEIVMANTTASNATITIGIGGTAAAQQIVPAMTVKAKETVILALSTPLTNGETLQALQGTASAITTTVSAEVKS